MYLAVHSGIKQGYETILHYLDSKTVSEDPRERARLLRLCKSWTGLLEMHHDAEGEFSYVSDLALTLIPLTFVLL